MKQEIRIRLEGVAPEWSAEGYEFGMACIKVFRADLPADHPLCYYVGQFYNCLVRRSPRGTVTAVVRPEVKP